MFPLLGSSLLWVAILCALLNIGATAWAYRVDLSRRRAFLNVAHRATTMVLVTISASAVALWVLFLTDDFTNNYVWGHSSIEQPFGYKISALWGGQGGSLLLWAWMLALYAFLVARFGRKDEIRASSTLYDKIMPTSVAVVQIVTIFFVGMIALSANPFLTGPPQKNGLGLNPLLQNYWMQIHPPTLYAGYVGCTVPFAIAMAALLHRETGKEWLAVVRRWTLFPWVILTIGIIMGGRWAYETLGWGGYWAWDPVENASLMPWLTGTAFIHSIMIQSRRGMLKTWNMTLVSLTFLLSIFGTFITRSGVISSVHSFAESNIGPYFLAFIAVALVASFALIASRRDILQPDNEMESPFSREGVFLLNNWLLVGATAAVLWGTIYPSIREAFVGESATVEQAYFNRVMIPIGLMLLFLTGVGPLMSWRKMSGAAMLRVFQKPLIVAIIAAPFLWMLSKWQTGAATSFALAVFVVAAILGEFWRGTIARQKATGEARGQAFRNLISRNRPRYGGYIVHLGIVTFMIGATGNAFKIETEPILFKKGDVVPLRRDARYSEYSLRFDGFGKPAVKSPEKLDEIAALMTVIDNRTQKPVTDRRGNNIVMTPSVDFFKAQGNDDAEASAGQEPQTASRPAIWVTPSHDVYLALTDFDTEKNTVNIKMFLEPLVSWIWISCIFFIGGTALSLWPERRRARQNVRVSETVGNRVLERSGISQSASTKPEVLAMNAHSDRDNGRQR